MSNARIPAVALPFEKRERARPDWQEMQMPIESIEQGARQLLGFGAEIEVIEPAELRDEVLRQASQLMVVYRGTANGRAHLSRR